MPSALAFTHIFADAQGESHIAQRELALAPTAFAPPAPPLDVSAVQAATGVEVLHVDTVDNRQDLDGLAALISTCDVVVTISNTTAHLAGALGIPTLLMLPTGVARHWYWHEGRVDSPWYPSMKIFRQRAVADWGGVFAEVGEALQAYSSKRKH
jgi:ADP-heptose:LPS heptosyltransferase